MDPAVLQAVRLKGGMADAAVIAALVGRDVSSELDAAVAAEHVQERRGRYRLMPPGRDVLREALAQERASLDTGALDEIWDAFTTCDHTLKLVLQDWQLRDGEPNDHSDSAYDAAIVARVTELHGSVAPLATRIAAAAPRLAGYPGRLDAALSQLQAGDTKYLSHPMVDSYHTVFHELHEELYDCTGKDRAAEEAAAG
jgi:hypothetical protein